MSIVWNTGAAAMRFRLKNKKKKGIIMENKTIQVTVMGGVIVDVKNLPEGWDLQIIDKDNEKN
jgi:archaellum component FlaG (FlaF/FlaG flagellin family)